MATKKQVKEPPFILAPASLPQEQFLSSTSNITLYSGSAK